MKTNTLNSSEKKSEFKKDNSVTVIRNVVRIFLIIWAILIILPLGWTILTSLKSADEVSFESAWSLPATLQWNNYAVAWTKANFSLFFMNSVILSVGTVILTLLMTTATAYVVSKFVHPVIKGIKWFFSLFMMVPQLLLLVPLYYMCDDLNLLSGGTVLVTLMITNALQGVPYYVFLLTPFMCGINNAILEAAEIDGASQFGIFIKIILPLAVPAIFMVGLLSFIGIWNEYIMSITFMGVDAKAYYTLSVGITRLMNTSQYGREIQFSALVLAMVPIIVIYAFFQKPLQNGLSSGEGVKG